MRSLTTDEETLLTVAEKRRVAAAQTRARVSAAAGEEHLVDAILRVLPDPVPRNRAEFQASLLQRKLHMIGLRRGLTPVLAMLTFGRDQALSQLTRAGAA
jgi:hypothetical protein